MGNSTRTKSRLIIIKLGGSVITHKESPKPQARIEVIKRLSKEIKQIIELDKYKLIIIHGAGSFAHGLVKKYGLHLGMKTEAQKSAYCLVTERMLKLNSIIMRELFKLKLNAVSLIPHTFITQSSSRLKVIETGIIKEYLDKNIVPVLFGDLVLDDKLGCSVVSGDAIAVYLGEKLNADKLIFLSDVDGVYDSDPKRNPSAKLISKITNKNLKEVLKGLSPANRDDVTGEMRGKIMQIKKNLIGVEVFVANGLKPQNLRQLVTQGNIGSKLSLS